MKGYKQSQKGMTQAEPTKANETHHGEKGGGKEMKPSVDINKQQP